MELLAQAEAAQTAWSFYKDVGAWLGPLLVTAAGAYFVYREKTHAANMEALKAKLMSDATIEKDRGGNDNAARSQLYEQLFKLVDEHKREIANLNAANIECEKRGDECEKRDREKEVRLAKLEMEFKHVSRKVHKIEESVNVPGQPTTVNVVVGPQEPQEEKKPESRIITE